MPISIPLVRSARSRWAGLRWGSPAGLLLQAALGAGLVLAASLAALALPRLLAELVAGTINGISRPTWTAAGLTAGALLFASLRHHPTVRMLGVLEHERTHALAAVLLGGRARSLVATEGSGQTAVSVSGPLPDLRLFLIAIAPYVLTPAIVGAGSLAGLVPARGPLLGALALVVAWALLVPLSQLSPRQTDFRRYGVVLPMAAAAGLWLSAAALELALLRAGGVSGIASAYRIGWATLERILG